jgi:hypothetical protein
MGVSRLGVLFVVALAAAGLGDGGKKEKTPAPANIDPRADEVLRKMSAALGAARSFSFRGETVMDEPVAPGQLAQFSRQVRVLVRRPDGILLQSRQGEDTWVLWYQGPNLTLLDKTAKTYAATQVPPRIEDMLEDIAAKDGLTLPLADLLFPDPYKVLTAQVQTGKYVGLHEVDGVKCHHLLFIQEFLDWQIWVDAGKEPVPRKVVIDYKTVPGRPSFAALLKDWNLSASAGNEEFKPTLPQGATQVELGRLLEAEQGGQS